MAGMRVRIAELPLELSPGDAVDAAYPVELDELARVAREGETALVECDPELAPHLHRALKARLHDPLGGRVLGARYLTGQAPGATALGPGRLELEVRPASVSGALLLELTRLLREGAPNVLLVVPHFELLAPSADPDGTAARGSREVAALLQDHPGVPVLALHAPDVLVPDALAEAFTRRGAIGAVATDRLRHLVLRREARKLDVEWFEPSQLAEHVEGLNALELRRALARLQGRIDHDPRFAAARDALLAELRAAPRRAREPRPMPDGAGSREVEWRLRPRG
jgi:hypothetical protein